MPFSTRRKTPKAGRHGITSAPVTALGAATLPAKSNTPYSMLGSVRGRRSAGRASLSSLKGPSAPTSVKKYVMTWSTAS